MSSGNTITQDSLESILDRKLEPLKAKLDTVIASIDFLDAKYEELNKKMEDLEKASSKVSLENKQLKDEVLRLSNSLNLNRDTMNDLEQYVRRECVEITGVPVDQAHEDTDDIAIQVGALMGIQIDKNDISVSHRLSKPRTYSSITRQGYHGTAMNPKIIVKFVRRDVRDKYYTARKNLRGKTTRDLGLSRHSDNKIYISESLSPKNKELFKQCLVLKRNKNYRFIWTHYGRIYLRKDVDSPATVISNLKDLERIQGKAH